MSTPLSGLGSSGTTIKKYATIPGAKENIINTSAYPSANVWCDVVKTYNSNKVQCSFNDYIRGRVDPNNGAYYYAYGYESTTYQYAMGRIPLSQAIAAVKTSSAGKKRRAYISLGVLTRGSTYTFCDVGLANDGSGWAPSCWINGFLTANGQPAKANCKFFRAGSIPIHAAGNDAFTPFAGNDPVTVKVEVGVTGNLDFVRAEFTYQGKTGSVAFDAPIGMIHPANGGSKPKVSFYRFMSMVPIANDADAGRYDDADHSALSGVLDSLQLNGTSWTADKVQYAYSVQAQNVPTLKISNIRPAATIGGNADYANIRYEVQTH